MEFLIVIAFFGYIFYLRNYADLRSNAEKEEDYLSEGINLYRDGEIEEAVQYFERRLAEKPKSAVAYLYRGLCRKSLGDSTQALSDLETATSLDDTFYDIQLELGRYYLENRRFEEARLAFSKAIAICGGDIAEPFVLRADCYSNLGQSELAQSDIQKAQELEYRPATKHATSKTKRPLVDKRLLASTLLVFATSSIIVAVIENAEGIHLPYLVAVFSAISIGFAEPYRGWMLAILQCVLIYLGYQFFATPPEGNALKELHYFSLYGSMILTFAGSFLGAFMKRALSMK
ncbi:tetratricopeptide repeat protein [Dyadobacter crusticola]|uniref:tetratricopeptide repeat protein n=1 Tax=Dyadobacter crusticola TaxID=292407 RepID=UPI0004E1C413|nr:tetratricopeptide repeat protein [Dyadobacter crusticola]